MSHNRRMRRKSERDSKKLFDKIKRETLQRIKNMTPEELEREVEKYKELNGNYNKPNQASE